VSTLHALLPRAVRHLGLPVLISIAMSGCVALPSAGAGASTARVRPLPPFPLDGKHVCAYTNERVSAMTTLDVLIHRRVDCAVVFSDAAADWSAWVNPWFLHHVNPDLNWARWAREQRGRRLVITQNFFPSSLRGTDWLTPGSQGAFTGHARQLARNLVAAGVGSAVIRLAHEANGPWEPHAVGPTALQARLWRRFWRVTVEAMRAVPGARFRFDWSIASGQPTPPLSRFYPGDDVVDIVGVDVYDQGVGLGPDRWAGLATHPVNVAQVAAFARRHRKPMSIPEWAIAPATENGGGDDPGFVEGVAQVVRTQRVAYQAYFFARQWADQLAASPSSLDAYRRHFGDGGDSVG
jgi:hypothetical protein